MAVKRSVRRSQQTERFERRRRPLEVDADSRRVVLYRDVVARRMRFRLRTANMGSGVPLYAPIGAARRDLRKGLARSNVATNARAVPARMGLAGRSGLHVRGKQQTRRQNRKRSCKLADPCQKRRKRRGRAHQVDGLDR